jgi:hypothetical protein
MTLASWQPHRNEIAKTPRAAKGEKRYSADKALELAGLASR